MNEKDRFDVASFAVAGVYFKLPTVPTAKTMLLFNSRVNSALKQAYSHGETGFDTIVLNFHKLYIDGFLRQASEGPDPLFKFLTEDIKLTDISEESHKQLIIISSLMDAICGSTWRVDALQQGIGELLNFRISWC